MTDPVPIDQPGNEDWLKGPRERAAARTRARILRKKALKRAFEKHKPSEDE